MQLICSRLSVQRAPIVLATILGFYSLLLLLIFVKSGWMPYGFDNNETFSNLIQGNNLLEFASQNPMLLTDESTALQAVGHPYVYTHGQNFPRFFAAVLLFLGIQAPHLHMLIAAFLGGGLAISLIFVSMKRLTGLTSAAFSSIFAASSVLYFLQVAPNTWRVWQLLLLSFTLFLIVDLIVGVSRSVLWRTLAAVTSLLSVSTELLFGFAISITLILATITQRSRSRSSTAFDVSSILAGLVVSVGALVTQLVVFLGFHTTLSDLRYTFLARNQGADTQASALFFIENDIAFWRNSLDLDLRSTGNLILGFLGEFLVYGLAWFAAPVLLIVTARLLLGPKRRGVALRNPPISGKRNFAELLVLSGSLGTLVFAVGVAIEPGIQAVLAAIGVGLGYGLVVVIVAKWVGRVSDSFGSTLFVSLVGGVTLVIGVYAATLFVPLTAQFQVSRRDLLLLIAGAAGAVFVHRFMQQPRPRALSVLARANLTVVLTISLVLILLPATASIIRIPIDLGLRNSPGLQSLAVVIAWLIAGIWATKVSSTSIDREILALPYRRLTRLVALFISGLAVAYLLSPGYLVTGYSSRLVPFFGLLAPIVTGALLGLMASQLHTYGVLTHGRKARFVAKWAFATVGILWLATNTSLISNLFNDQFATLYRTVEERTPAGIVSTSYPAPWAYAAKTWAYMDLGTPSPPNIDQILAGEQYVWLRGAVGDPQYANPDAVICWSPILPSQFLLVNDPVGGCSSSRIFNADTRIRSLFIMNGDEARFLYIDGAQVTSR